MIRINLLKPLQSQAQPLIFDEPGVGRKKLFLVLGGIALLAAGAMAVLQFPSLFGGLLGGGEDTEATVTAPEPAHPEGKAKPKRVTSHAVEEVVREVGETGANEPTYAEMVPSERIEFQYFASSRILKDIKAVTPPDVGFANFIFTPPGDFYVHGLASGAGDLARFQEALSGLEGASIRPGLNAPAGARGLSREFSFFGSVKYPLNAMPTPPDRVIGKENLQSELKRLKTVAGSLGVKLKEPRLSSSGRSGAFTRQIYSTSADCSYQQLQDLLSGLHEGKSNLGLVKFALRARGDEKVAADLDLLVYMTP